MVSVMTERIGKDLFAAVMRMPSRDRYDILEYLGQSPVLPETKSLVSTTRARSAAPLASGSRSTNSMIAMGAMSP
jgi:hypothetical protein